MQNYKITITETLQKEVSIEAGSRTQAEQLAEQNWKNSEYILDADNFVGVTFRGERPTKQRGYDR
ncbi:MAG: DpnD/PcfM family protein [Saezia sp.]